MGIISFSLEIFRIGAKAVLATVRMKFMVRRWKGRSMKIASCYPTSGHEAVRMVQSTHRLGDALPSNPLNKDAATLSRFKKSPVPGLTLSSLSKAGTSEVETVLSEYLRRIKSLEDEVEGVIVTSKRDHHKP